MMNKRVRAVAIILVAIMILSLITSMIVPFIG